MIPPAILINFDFVYDVFEFGFARIHVLYNTSVTIIITILQPINLVLGKQQMP